MTGRPFLRRGRPDPEATAPAGEPPVQTEDDVLGLVQEIARPAVMSTGRLRIAGYPAYDRPPVEIVELPLEFGSFPDAVATPRVLPGKRVGTLYDRDGARIDAARRGKRGFGWDDNPLQLPERYAEPETVVRGRSLFIGYWGTVFGHVLLETLPRFWPDVDYSVYDHLVCYPKRLEVENAERKPYVDAFVVAAGATRADLVLVTEGARFEQIDVPSAPVLMKDAADPRYLAAFDRIADNLLDGYEPVEPLPSRVYLSRAHLNVAAKRKARNETKVQDIMRRRGFTVVHPQEATITRQVALMRNADVVAGCDGSALHMTAFARPGTKLLAIDSRTVPNQFLVDQPRGLDAVHVLAIDEALAINQRSEAWRILLNRTKAGLDLLLDS